MMGGQLKSPTATARAPYCPEHVFWLAYSTKASDKLELQS
eukprot:COSAG02_NODE_59717_length_273_cov_0.885057_1_plen_39_part_10